MTEIDRESIQKILNHYGMEHQSLKCAEEMAELQVLILQDANSDYKKVPIVDIVEEIADVYIMLEQVKLIYHITDDDIKRIVDYKLKRTFFRMENE